MVITLTATRQCCFCRRYGTGTYGKPTHLILTRTGKLRQCKGRMERIEPRKMEVMV